MILKRRPAPCAVTALLETGMKQMVEPETVVTLDTAAGPVKARARCENGKVTRISLDMPPSFVVELDAVVETRHWGPIRYDLCFGGVFYALVDVGQIGLTIAPEHARELATTGVAIRNAIAAETDVSPAKPGDFPLWFKNLLDADQDIRTVPCLVPPLRISGRALHGDWHDTEMAEHANKRLPRHSPSRPRAGVSTGEQRLQPVARRQRIAEINKEL